MGDEVVPDARAALNHHMGSDVGVPADDGVVLDNGVVSDPGALADPARIRHHSRGVDALRTALRDVEEIQGSGEVRYGFAETRKASGPPRSAGRR